MQSQQTKTSKAKALALREKAEEVAGQNPLFLMRHSPEEVQHLVHDLYVYQIELEAQNEELRRVQHELIETRSEFLDFFDSAPVAYLTLDLDGRIDRINLAACELLGRPRRDLVMKPFYQCVNPPYRETYESFDARLRRDSKRVTERVRIMQRGQPGAYVQLEGAPLLNKNGDQAGLAITICDISDFDPAAHSPAAGGRPAIEGHTALVRIARCIAHDFNNLLSVILGNAQEHMGRPDHKPEVRRAFSDVNAAATRLARITEQLHAFAGHNFVRYQTVYLSELANDMQRELAGEIPASCSLTVACPEDLPRARIAEGQFPHLLRNLVRNAVESLDCRNGEITIRTGAHHCDETFLKGAWALNDTAPGEYVFVEVGDNGAGISATALAHVFEPFFTTKNANNGMGLAEVFGIVCSHHGFLTVESEPGGGTRIRCYFPAVSGDGPARRQEKQPERRPETATVLVVDDNPQVLALTKRRLESLQYQVYAELSGRDALVTLESYGEDIDVVLLDVEMPGLNGVETFDRMRQMRSDMRALFTSGYTHEVLGAMEDDPRVDFIGKPYMNDELVAKINGLLQR